MTAKGHPALLNAAIFCAASVIGVHLAWEILKAGANPNIHLPNTTTVDVAAFLVAFAKVAQAWVVETRRSLDAAETAAVHAAERAELSAIRKSQQSAAPADQPAMRPTSQAFQPTLVEGGRPASHLSQIGQPLVGAAAVSAAVVGVMADRSAQATAFDTTTIEQTSHSAQTWACAEDHAAALLNAGSSQRSVVRDTGLTRYRVARIADRISGRTA